ncbi:LysR family transcriptional regulator [Billgrantia sulfidoxydans]|uniref:LysR family transcriptional regulator n=1 Tax=Billgrantia sulfidoxydans TaxID=2733484 RepID=A0ABX7W0U8_9GAMM|nr:LysR family transcriptional regulator [Halomonas sulfidoxydans]QTP53883.1 LysR family transcriptional regulator [Halomonas sulfidoxydans]
MSRVDDLSLFLRILDLGSISEAARSLDLSVAVASQRLKRLERELGVRLLQRTTRQLRPTPEGRSLAEQGREAVEDLEALMSGLHQSTREVTGTLRLTLPPTFGRLYVSPLLPRFLRRYPRLRLDLDLSDQRRDIVGSGFDLAIRIGSLADSSMVARRLATNRRVLCASPAYLKRHGIPRTPEELTRHECLVLTGGEVGAGTWRLRDINGEWFAVKVDGRIRSSQGELLRDAAVAGLGIVQHSTWHVCDDLQAGRLQQVLSDYALPETGIHAVMPQRRLAPPRVRAFIDFLVEQWEPVPPWERHKEDTR